MELFTSPADAYLFALRRAAEVTKEAGFRYFVMMDKNQTSDDYQFQAVGAYRSYINGFQEPRTAFLIKCSNASLEA